MLEIERFFFLSFLIFLEFLIAVYFTSGTNCPSDRIILYRTTRSSREMNFNVLRKIIEKFFSLIFDHLYIYIRLISLRKFVLLILYTILYSKKNHFPRYYF